MGSKIIETLYFRIFHTTDNMHYTCWRHDGQNTLDVLSCCKEITRDCFSCGDACPEMKQANYEKNL